MKGTLMGKALLKAFFAGGVMGIITQILLLIWVAILGPESAFSGPLTLVSLGLLTLITYPSGLFYKVQDWSGWGIMLTFSGLAGAVAGLFQNVKAGTGSAGKAMVEAFKLVFGIVIIGAIPFIVLDCIFVLCHADLGIAAAIAASVPELSLPAVFGMAFVVGGILAAIFQFVAMTTKATPPTLLKIGFAIGGCVAPFGILAWLEAIGGGGAMAMVVDAGGALSGTFMALLGTGDPMPILMVIGIFVALVLIGCLTGAISKKQPPKH